MMRSSCRLLVLSKLDHQLLSHCTETESVAYNAVHEMRSTILETITESLKSDIPNHTHSFIYAKYDLRFPGCI